MKKIKKTIIVLLIIIPISFSLPGCWNYREINTLAFIVSLGFDKADDGDILLSVQVLNPRAIASQKTVNEPTVVVYTEKGKDSREMIRKLVTQSPRRLNATHLQMVVFSEEFAKEGISDILDLFTREHEFRQNMYFSVAKGTSANSILNTLTKLETNPSIKLYTSIKYSDEIWAGTKAVKITELINSIISDGINPVLTGVELTGNTQGSDTIESLKEIRTDPIKVADMAVFKKDKFTGWLNEDETKGYNYITEHAKSTIGKIEDKRTGKISGEVTHTKSKQKAYLTNGKPAVTVDIKVNVIISSTSDIIDVTKMENIQLIEKLIQEKITDLCNKAVNKTQKNLKSDIFGFGELVHSTYPKLWTSLKDNWNNEFSGMPVKVNVSVNVKATGTVSKSYFFKEQK